MAHDNRSSKNPVVSEQPPRYQDATPNSGSPPGSITLLSSTPGRTWLLALAAGLVGGLAGFGVGELAPHLIRPSLELSPEIRRNTNQVPIVLGKRAAVARDQRAMMAYGGLGTVLGLTLGAAGGLARRSPRAAIMAALTGLVLGGAAGAVSTVIVLPYYHAARAAASQEDYTKDLAFALATHAGIWLSIGAAAGLAFGIGLGGQSRMARALIGGILGAGLAAVIYEFGGAILFPLGETFRPMAAEIIPRFIAHLAVGLLIAAGALMGAEYLTVGRPQPRSNP